MKIYVCTDAIYLLAPAYRYGILSGPVFVPKITVDAVIMEGLILVFVLLYLSAIGGLSSSSNVRISDMCHKHENTHFRYGNELATQRTINQQGRLISLIKQELVVVIGLLACFTFAHYTHEM